MKDVFQKLAAVIQSNFVKHRVISIFLLIVLVVSFGVRVYRAGELMGFYYDQGRDALVVWKLWNEGKPFLIGPVTGLTGIFLGPIYYYLIAPFYLIGGGNPVFPAYFLAFTSTAALFVLYILGVKIHSRTAGIFAAIIGGFSYYIVLASRWVSNPTPILLTSVLLFWALWEIANAKKPNKYLWPIVAILVGVSVQFESASGVFYIPIVILFSIVYRLKLPDIKIFVVSLLMFFLTLVPQILFNFRHDNLLFNNFYKVIFAEKSFRANFWDVLPTRLTYFWDVFQSKIFLGLTKYSYAISLLSIFSIIFNIRKLNKNIIPVFTMFLGVPAFFYIMFQGNHGNIYDYYLTGYYLPMILLFSLGLAVLFSYNLGKIIVVLFFCGFVFQNGVLLKNLLSVGIDGQTHITLGNQKQAVNWIFQDAVSKNISEYNIDVYVPPVIPYTYDYLFLWLGTEKCGDNLCGYVKDRHANTLYTLYEVDPPHPERLESWLSKYEVNTIVLEEKRYGGIYVQRRERILR